MSVLMAISDEKVKLRDTVLRKLKEQSSEERQSKSKAIASKLKQDAVFQKAKVVMFYVSIAQEVETISLLKEFLREGKIATVPYVDSQAQTLVSVEIKNPDQELTPGSYGILEPYSRLVRPFDLNRLDLVLVPGIAFDHEGHRLGRGRGYYDRFLKTLPAHVKRYGLAFDFQLLDSIPFTDEDVSMDQVITNL